MCIRDRAKELALSSGYDGPIHHMPFSLHVPICKDIELPKNKVNFLITGSITSRSRDYFAILELFEKIWDSGVKTAVLTVLSSPRTDYGFKVYNEMQRLEGKGYPIRYFAGWIPEEEFVSQSAKADFLIAPILKEYYGAGEITSVEVESVRMGIPAFYPEWYYVDHDRLDSSILYSSFTHLHKLIMEFVSDTSRVESIRLRALKNVENLSVEPVSKKLSEFLNQQIFSNLSGSACVMKNVDE